MTNRNKSEIESKVLTQDSSGILSQYSEAQSMKTEGNQCIALGAGVGGIGAAAAIVIGATCPLCYVVAPGLVGLGLYRRSAAKRKMNDLVKISDGTK